VIIDGGFKEGGLWLLLGGIIEGDKTQRRGSNEKVTKR
jgi:hypothetical protein